MAQAILLEKKIYVEYEKGSATYGDVQLGATDHNVFEVGVVLGGLTTETLNLVGIIEEKQLTD